MGRKSSKTKEEVLGICRDVFWSRGYGQTSMKDIVQATGLQPGSLYHFFKNKEDLFEQVIDFYFDSVLQPRFDGFLFTDKGSPEKNIREFFHCVLDIDQKDRFGCLMVNTSIEVVGQNYVDLKLSQMLDTLEKGFLFQIDRMKKHEGKSRREKTRIALQLVVANQGFWSLVRLGSEDRKLKKYIESIVSVLH